MFAHITQHGSSTVNTAKYKFSPTCFTERKGYDPCVRIYWIFTGGGGKRCYRLIAHLLNAFLLLASLFAAQAFAQTALQLPTATQTIPSQAPLTLVEIHRQLDQKAVFVHAGNAQAIADLSSTVFQRVGIPVEADNAFHYTARLAQAETDYIHGAHAAIHEEDLVRANNNFVLALGAPEWAQTTQPEVRKLRMEFMARYPQLLANLGPPDENGRFQALSNNISPIEASFLATSLLYQKLYVPAYQLSSKEQAAGGRASISATAFRQRTQQMYDLLHGNSLNVDLVSLAHAADGLFSDLGISNILRPEFENLQAPNALTAGNGGR